ncbi:pro-resilin-like [Anabrus simplex]|uniref:pro-resilin-like n=1 Tax=Anabrus simplex TaxID=316456 RepID=UPI0035A2D048
MVAVGAEKAFDNVNWNIVLKALRSLKVDYRDRKIIYQLYKNQTALKGKEHINEKIRKEYGKDVILCVALVASLLVMDVTARAALGYGRGPAGGGAFFNAAGGGGGGGFGGGAGADGPPRPYSFQYNVQDAPSGNDFGQNESSDGSNVQGTYYVVLPDGRRQTVKYTANDATGYVADVQYSGGGAGGGGGGAFAAPGGGFGGGFGGRPGGSYLPPGRK